LFLSACRPDQSKVRIGIAVEPGWYSAVRLAQAKLADLPIEWVEDSTRNVQVASLAIDYASWLATQHVAAVVGHSGSRGSVAAGGIYAQEGIVQIAPIATARELTGHGRKAFGLAPNDSTEGAFIGAFVDSALHARRVALLYHQDEYGLGIRDGVAGELGRRSVRVVDERFLTPEGAGAEGLTVDVQTLLAASLRSQPDAIVLGARIAETREIAAYIKKHHLNVPVVCSDGSYVLPPDPKSRVLTDLDGFYIVRFWDPDHDPAASAFAHSFRERYGYLPDQSEAYTYDALMLAGSAVRDGARSPADFARILGERGSFINGRPRDAHIEMAIVREGVLQRLAAVSPR
jgi:branched-chain amino acid transport system substrate-binding protein